MTIEETIKYFKNCNGRIISTAIDENADSKFMEETIDANNMAIKSLEAWEEVKVEMQEQYKTFANISSISDVWADALDIVDKHLSEVSE